MYFITKIISFHDFGQQNVFMKLMFGNWYKYY